MILGIRILASLSTLVVPPSISGQDPERVFEPNGDYWHLKLKQEEYDLAAKAAKASSTNLQALLEAFKSLGQSNIGKASKVGAAVVSGKKGYTYWVFTSAAPRFSGDALEGLCCCAKFFDAEQKEVVRERIYSKIHFTHLSSRRWVSVPSFDLPQAPGVTSFEIELVEPRRAAKVTFPRTDFRRANPVRNYSGVSQGVWK